MTNTLGKIRYDAQGNVLATFTARKLPVETDGDIMGFSAHVTSMTDYYRLCCIEPIQKNLRIVQATPL